MNSDLLSKSNVNETMHSCHQKLNELKAELRRLQVRKDAFEDALKEVNAKMEQLRKDIKHERTVLMLCQEKDVELIFDDLRDNEVDEQKKEDSKSENNIKETNAKLVKGKQKIQEPPKISRKRKKNLKFGSGTAAAKKKFRFNKTK